MTIERAIDRVGGRTLQDAIEDLVLKKTRYHNARRALTEHDSHVQALGWRGKLIHVVVSRFVKREGLKNEMNRTEKALGRSEKELKRIEKWLKSEKMIGEIEGEAKNISLSRSENKPLDRKSLEKNIELHIERTIQKKTPELSRAIEQTAMAIQMKKGRGL